MKNTALVVIDLQNDITQIPVAVKAAEASKAGQSILKYDHGSKPANAYEQLTEEVMRLDERKKRRDEASIDVNKYDNMRRLNRELETRVSNRLDELNLTKPSKPTSKKRNTK